MNYKRSFTLIELVMTIVIVSIIAIPLALTVSRYIESTFESTDYTIAQQLARLEMEKVNNLPYGSIITSSFLPYPANSSYDVIRTVNFAHGNATSQESTRRVVVEVRRAGSSTNLVRLITFISRNVVFGI